MASLVINDQTFEDEDIVSEIDCPVEVEYIWEWYIELDATRQNGMGYGPITHQEITAWSVGMKIDLMPFERESIRAIDREFLIHSQKTKDKK